MCACVSLCTTVVNNAAQNSSDNLPSVVLGRISLCTGRNLIFKRSSLAITTTCLSVLRTTQAARQQQLSKLLTFCKSPNVLFCPLATSISVVRCRCYIRVSKAQDTRTRNWYRKPVTENGTGFSVQVFRSSCVWYQNFWYHKQTWQTIQLQLLPSVFLLQLLRKTQKTEKERFWMQLWIANRQTHGAYHALLQELDSLGSYRNFLRMDRGSFEMLLHKVAPYIRRQDTTMRLSITPEERLDVTLWYLATHSLPQASRPIALLTQLSWLIARWPTALSALILLCNKLPLDIFSNL